MIAAEPGHEAVQIGQVVRLNVVLCESRRGNRSAVSHLSGRDVSIGVRAFKKIAVVERRGSKCSYE
jgi:hypothetical protein